MSSPAPAHTPVPALPGLDPAHSRFVHTKDAQGATHTWHVLDNGPQLAARGERIVGTLLCSHGNPTWSYLWRRVLEQAPKGWRVIAPDHLGMGYSERTSEPRRLAQRIADLGDLTAALEVSGPVALLAHDWGGPIGLGWALEHREHLAGIVLTNTAVHQPEGSPAPAAIRLARAPGVLDLVCRRTPTFVRATTGVSSPTPPADVRDAFSAPYATAELRTAVADFVADIPLEADHPSMPALQAIQDGLPHLAGVPALLVWGPADPVFSQRYLRDMLARLPHADVHRFSGASHLVLEDRPEGVGIIWDWLTIGTGDDGVPHPGGHLTSDTPALGEDAAPHGADDVARVSIVVHCTPENAERTAIVELGEGGSEITFGDLAERVTAVARGLSASGVRPGDRVAVLVPPGIDLTTVVYALWRLRAVIVIADAGLGLRRMAGALRGANVDHVVGIAKALALVEVSGVPGTRIRFDGPSIDDLIAAGANAHLPQDLQDTGADGAILFTSGATGPPKGVVYSRGRLSAQVAMLSDAFSFGPGHRIVAAFAPFALYGPALGMAAAVPDMDVTAPHTLTASALAEAVGRADANVVFASPAALRNVVATDSELSYPQRQALNTPELVLSAGAPVPPALLHQVKAMMPNAATHTPYGMTEALPVSTLDPTTMPAQASAQGVCVGTPLAGVQVRIDPLHLNPTDFNPADLNHLDQSPEELTDTPGLVGEIVIHGPHTKSRYDQLWGTQRASNRPAGWHRSGDVGYLDADGRLWVQGRRAHVVWTADGPLTPYGPEQRIEQLPGVSAAAVVGVGPAGTAQAVAIIVPQARLGANASPLVPPHVAAKIREQAGVELAAVLARDWLPVDVRHASKVDRSELARWATKWLHGADAARELKPRTGSAPTTRSR